MSKILVNEVGNNNGTTGMTIDTSGRVLTPARPAFVAKGTNNAWVDVADNATVTIVMPAIDINIGGHYNTSTYRFIAPIAGLYWVQQSVYLRNNSGSGSDSGTYGYTGIRKNGANLKYLRAIHGYLNNGDADQTHGISGILELAVNDYIDSYMVSYGGGTSSYSGDAVFLSGYLMG